MPVDENNSQQIWRVIAIDDTVSIHNDYRKVLTPQNLDRDDLKQAEEALFGVVDGVENAPDYQYQIDSAYQGEEGFNLICEAIESGNLYSVAFVDVRMPPGWDGVETVRRIWEVAPDLPIVLCTAYSDYGWEEISRQLPRTDQLLILKKPFEPLELRQIAASQAMRWHLNRVANQNQMELEATIRRRTRQINSTRNLVFASLARLAESRDPETGEHLERIEYYSRVLLEKLLETNKYPDVIDQNYIANVSRSSILHDIGKVGIPDNILLKPGALTAEEFEVMKTHTTIGADSLDDAASQSSDCQFLETAAEIARFHHERFDGAGYPEGRAGDDIPLSARVVAVVDVFDALTSERIYKNAMCPLEAKAIIVSESGKHFDPILVETFVDSWDRFYESALENQAATRERKRELPEPVQEVSQSDSSEASSQHCPTP